MCKDYRCPECNDRLIHQHRRGRHESSSAFGQWVHEKVPAQMDFSDTPDWSAVRQRTDPPLYIGIEHKTLNGKVSESEQFTLPRFAKMVELATPHIWHPESRVVVLYCDPPFDKAYMQEVTPGTVWHENDQVLLDQKQLVDLVMARTSRERFG